MKKYEDNFIFCHSICNKGNFSDGKKNASFLVLPNWSQKNCQDKNNEKWPKFLCEYPQRRNKCYKEVQWFLDLSGLLLFIQKSYLWVLCYKNFAGINCQNKIECPKDLPKSFAHPQVSFLSVFHLSFCSSFSVFLDLLPWKRTQERALLVQDEEKIKRQERSTERALPQQENEEVLPKVSIPIPEDHKSFKKCHLYSNTFPSPRIPFMMSFLVVLALAVWWLVFLWLENRVLIWNVKTKTVELLTSVWCPLILIAHCPW